MCGILYVKAENRPAKKILWKRYVKQSDRGTDGYGYIAIEDGFVKNVTRALDEDGIYTKVKNETCKEILFHHRFPTSTPNFLEATHPIKISHASLEHDYYIIHNGIISNDDAMKKKHEEMGIEYSTAIRKSISYEVYGKVYKEEITNLYNDSECLGYEIALTLEGKQKEVEAKGAAAVIMLECTKEGKVLNLHYVRNASNPMKRERKDAFFALKSEGPGEDVPIDMLHTIDYASGVETRRAFSIPLNMSTTYGMGYTYDKYMGEEYWNDVRSYSKRTPKEDKEELEEMYDEELDTLEEKSRVLYEEKAILESDIEMSDEIIKHGDSPERHAAANEKEEAKMRLKLLSREIEQVENVYNELLADMVNTR